MKLVDSVCGDEVNVLWCCLHSKTSPLIKGSFEFFTKLKVQTGTNLRCLEFFCVFLTLMYSLNLKLHKEKDLKG